MPGGPAAGQVVVQGVVVDDAAECLAEGVDVAGRAQDPRIADDLGHRPAARRDHGAAAGERLGRGKSETLVRRRQDAGAGPAVERVEDLPADRTEPAHTRPVEAPDVAPSRAARR